MVIRTNSRITEIAVYLVALVVIILMMGALAPQAAEPTKTANRFIDNDIINDSIVTFNDNIKIINFRDPSENHWEDNMHCIYKIEINKYYKKN